MKSFIISLFFLIGCTHFKDKPIPKDEPFKITETEIQECKDYKKNILQKAFREIKSKKSVDLVFVKDPQEAQSFLQKFDVSKGLMSQKSIMVKNIINYCDDERVKKFDQDYKAFGSCSLMFSELSYFQALSVALKDYRWPTLLKLEGKKVALDYVRFFAEGSYPLLNRLVALSVLDELCSNGIINKELHKEVKVIMDQSRDYVETLRTRLTNDPGLSCKSIDIVRDELEYSNKVATKMKEMLKQI